MVGSRVDPAEKACAIGRPRERSALNFAMDFDGFYISMAFLVAMTRSSPDGEGRTR